jgi:AraC family ethanolamine operon transcriptional activator
MNARLADPFEMVDLCQAIRVCPRTLRYSFDEVVGVAPTQYLLAIRLGRVRRALLQAHAASNVQCAAAQFGFSHMGRFARFYQDAFGERPSDTLRRSSSRPALANAAPDRRWSAGRFCQNRKIRLQAVGSH